MTHAKYIISLRLTVGVVSFMIANPLRTRVLHRPTPVTCSPSLRIFEPKGENNPFVGRHLGHHKTAFYNWAFYSSRKVTDSPLLLFPRLCLFVGKTTPFVPSSACSPVSHRVKDVIRVIGSVGAVTSSHRWRVIALDWWRHIIGILISLMSGHHEWRTSFWLTSLSSLTWRLGPTFKIIFW